MNHYKFTGQERDPETGMDYFNARHYTSQYGRFLQPDPAGMAAVDPSNPQTWNQYAYVGNNPLNFTDPTGMDWRAIYHDNTGDNRNYDPQALTFWILEMIVGGTPGGDFYLGQGQGDQYVYEDGGIVGIYYQTDSTSGCPANAVCPGQGPGSNNPGGGGGTQSGPQPPSPQPRPEFRDNEQQYDKCVSDFKNSKAGKVVQFGSVLSFASNFWDTAKTWTEAILVKGSYFKVAEVAGQSAQAAGEVSPVTTVVKPIVGDLATAGVVGATFVDLEARRACFLKANPDVVQYEMMAHF